MPLPPDLPAGFLTSAGPVRGGRAPHPVLGVVQASVDIGNMLALWGCKRCFPGLIR